MRSPVVVASCVGATAALLAMPARSELTISGLEVSPRLDLRAEGGSGTPDRLHVMAVEINTRFSVNKDDEELVAVALGPTLYTDMTGRARQMHFTNAYTVWNFGVDKPKLKVGQFVIPFGTLAEYDTHPLLLQTPYARTLGIRMDRGLEVEGFRGKVNWRVSLTGGDGRSRADGGYAATLRLARDYERGGDAFRVGLSLLHGEQMPILPLDPMPLPMDDHIMDRPVALRRADKDRLALDLDWLHGIDNLRAELVLGRDDNDMVNGQWVSWNHPFSYNTDLTVQADRWKQRDGSVLGLGIALHHKLDDLSGLRLAYEPRWAWADGMERESVGLVTLQWYRNFSLSF